MAAALPQPRIVPTAEDAVLIEFSQQIDPALTPLIAAWSDSLREALGHLVTDLVPSYGSITVYYDPDRSDFLNIIRSLKSISNILPELSDQPTGRIIELPVWYHPAVGPDLAALAEARQLSTQQVAKIHSDTCYQVYALGFSPGFGFMGQVDPAIATPRLERPRVRIPAGSVGIANRQTAVYPAVSPGGWQLIGRCPVRLFDEQSLALLSVGDRVRFRAVGHDEFLELGGDDTPFEGAGEQP
ncbi:5-oxoprolinase subunit PxpB [Marinobacter bryozoorum]|uniref:5-oxoprolinase subunit PxpB n=1 Tax=Marinobacter bryozoorum TaxID=256324 RepID=UPI0020051369|nr:5-oxoprolinase subunit PxpB [Marinobacter bryozoorum]MCK7543015.1 5-oxoprolinase subunit PxpB [Marinobacter bryozoorum]